MAMTPDHNTREPGTQHATALDTAADGLRHHTDDRWVEIADNMLNQALRTSRASHPVRGVTPNSSFHVSEQVLTSAVHASLDAVDHCEANAIDIHTDGDTYTGITVAITAQYGQRLIAVADQVREQAQHQLTQILGPVDPPVTVTTMHVHISDISTQNPKIS